MDLRSRFLQPRPPPLAHLCRRDVIASSRSSACTRPGNSCFAEMTIRDDRHMNMGAPKTTSRTCAPHARARACSRPTNCGTALRREIGHPHRDHDHEWIEEREAVEELDVRVHGVSPAVASGHTQRSHVRPTTSMWPSARAPDRSATRRERAFCGRMAEIAYDSRRTSRA